MSESMRVQPSRHPAGVRELRGDFASLDANRDGRLNYVEFKQLLEGLEAGMSEHDMHIGFHEVDTDRDGFIDCEEFIAWWSLD